MTPLRRFHAITGAAVAALVVVATTAACLIERVKPPAPAPSITVVAEVVGKGRRPCVAAANLERLHNPVPAGAHAVVRLSAYATESVPLRALEDAMAAKAADRCVQGLSVLRAGTEDGGRTFVSAVAVAWARDPPAPPVEVRDAGASPDAGDEDF